MAGPWTGDVNFDIVDGGAGVFSGPANSVQCVIGVANAGTNNAVVPSGDPSALQATFEGGPLLEAAGLICGAGGVVLAVKAATVTAGVIRGTAQATTSISDVQDIGSVAEITYTAQTPHVLQTGDVVTIAGVTGSTEVNGTWKITVTSATKFTVPVASITPYVSGGTVEWTGAITGGGAAGAVGAFAGTAAPYFTGTPTDTMYIQVVAQNGFTVGTTGGTVLVSFDAGRTYGPPIPVGTSTTLALADSSGVFDSGVTLNLGGSGKTWVGGGISNGKPVGDFARCSTIEPLTDTAGVQAAMAAVDAYLSGQEAAFPLFHVPGIWTAANAATFQSGGTTNLETFADEYLFERMLMPTADASPPSAWGGTGESESTWSAAIVADFASTVANRVSGCAGYYNMTSAFGSQIGGISLYRRPFSFALAARQVAIQPQTMAAKVADGNIKQIVSLPSDSTDGFIYHNEFTNPVFDYTLRGGVSRLSSARTHARKTGWYASVPLTLAPQGSSFSFLPRAIVMDYACAILHSVLVMYSYADLTLKPNGTLSDASAGTVKSNCTGALNAFMVGVGMVSGFSVAVDQTQNINVTGKLSVRVAILGRGYIMEEDVTVGFVDSLQTQ